MSLDGIDGNAGKLWARRAAAIRSASPRPTKTTFTFTAPTKAGSYQWWCSVPCDPWAMKHDGYMRGVVKVIA